MDFVGTGGPTWHIPARSLPQRGAFRPAATRPGPRAKDFAARRSNTASLQIEEFLEEKGKKA